MWSSPRDRRRSTRTRNTASCSSSTSGRRPLIRVPTMATELRIGGVGLASLAGGGTPGPGGQFRWHQPPAHSARSRFATCFPIPLQPSIAHARCFELPTEPQQRLVAGDIGAIPAATKNSFFAVHDFDRCGLLSGSIPITTPLLIPTSSASQPPPMMSWEGTASSSRANPS